MYEILSVVGDKYGNYFLDDLAEERVYLCMRGDRRSDLGVLSILHCSLQTIPCVVLISLVSVSQVLFLLKITLYHSLFFESF